MDEVYVGVNRHGQQFVVPVQAKGGNDQLGVTQTRQDIACCRQKFPRLTCRPVSAQFMPDDTIALFELALQGEDVKIVEEKHYKLVPSDQIGAETSSFTRSGKTESGAYGPRAEGSAVQDHGGDPFARQYDHRVAACKTPLGGWLEGLPQALAGRR